MKFNNLQKFQEKRLVPKFDEDENKKLDRQINKLIIEISDKLKDIEFNIKDLITEKTISNSEEKIKSNMKQLLFSRLNEITKKYKINQEIYTKKYKELVGEDFNNNNNNFYENNNNNNNNQNNFFKMSDENNILQKRDSELNILLNSINDLAEVFKDMQTLVMEQGSILDRIDYNIGVASANVSSGKKNIEKADKYHKSNCFRNVIIILIVCIFIEGLLLIFKFI
jgi:syntaxin 16